MLGIHSENLAKEYSYCINQITSFFALQVAHLKVFAQQGLQEMLFPIFEGNSDSIHSRVYLMSLGVKFV